MGLGSPKFEGIILGVARLRIVVFQALGSYICTHPHTIGL